VVRLALRESALAAARFEIDVLEMVTRDGVVLRVGESIVEPNGVAPARSFQAIVDTYGPGKEFGVHAAIAPIEKESDNIDDPAAVAGRPPGRFVVTPRTVPDLYLPADNDPVEVEQVGWRVALWFDVEDGFDNVVGYQETVPLIRLKVAREGATPVATYAPPALRLDATPTVIGLVREVRDLVKAKSLVFSRDKRDRGIQGSTGSPQDLMRLMILGTLNSMATDLQLLSERPASHPELAYALFRRIVGDLSAFSEEVDVTGAFADEPADDGLPAYDHLRSGPQLKVARDLIERLLDGLSIGPEMMVEMTWDGEQYFQADLPLRFFEGRAKQYWLIIESPSHDGDEMRRHLNDTGKLGAPDVLPDLIRRNLIGVPVEWEQFPPENLPRRSRRYFYFRVDPTERGGENWRHVEERQLIALYAPDLQHEETTVMLAKTAAED
jgi:type VI secretion system protein ImpJ